MSAIRRSRLARPALALVLATIGLLIASTLVSAFGGGWAPPRRVFTASVVPSHEMVTGAGGSVHITSDRGSDGIWYITNAGGSWTECQVSGGDDRRPSIAVEGSTVHIAFARMSDGERGIYTASSDQLGPAAGCAWRITRRYAGAASHPSLQVRDGALSVAFRTDDQKLRFLKGPADTEAWAPGEVIDGSCCTSPVVLVLTHTGAPRVVYGDGASTAQGLKFAVRTSSGWQASRAHGGRVTQVAMALDQTPGLFGQPPSDAPRIAYVVKRQGTYLATKGNAGTSGSWGRRFLGKAFGAVDVTHSSNITYIVFTRSGGLRYARASGGIWVSGSLSGSGLDGQPQLAAGHLTFTRKGSPSGIWHTD